jgi:hypothetical protein
MDVNPYESPQVVCNPKPSGQRRIVTDWFSLVGLLVGSLAAVAVGMVIQSEQAFGNWWMSWLLLSCVATVGVIATTGRVLGTLVAGVSVESGGKGRFDVSFLSATAHSPGRFLPASKKIIVEIFPISPGILARFFAQIAIYLLDDEIRPLLRASA